MKKTLKTMLNDIKPKSIKSSLDGIFLSVILIIILTIFMTIFLGIAIGIALLVNLPVDIVVIGMLLVFGLTAWIYDAHDRS